MADTWETPTAAPVADAGVPGQTPEAVAAAPTEPAAPPADEDDAHAVTTPTGERYVPLSVVKALRDQVRTLKPAAETAASLEAEINAARPYVDFLRNNPHLLQRPQPTPPAAPSGPSLEDQRAVELAKRFDLYTADGQPDTARGRAILTDQMAMARAAAQEAVAPVQRQGYAQRAEANLMRLGQASDAAGNRLDPQYANEVVRAVIANLAPDAALEVLADPKVAELLETTAWGLQAKSGRAPQAVARPTRPPLATEAAGGGGGVTLNEASKRLAKAAGVPEEKFAGIAATFKPGTYNSLE